MTGRVFFLDVGIPMYAGGAEHPLKEACVWVMQAIAQGRLRAAVDTETLQEILHRFGAIRRWELGTRMAESLLDLVPLVYPVVDRDVRRAIELFRSYGPRGLPARDVLHAAVMQNHGLTHILSADRHFGGIQGLTLVTVETLEQTRSDLERLSGE